MKTAHERTNPSSGLIKERIDHLRCFPMLFHMHRAKDFQVILQIRSECVSNLSWMWMLLQVLQ